MNRRDFLLLGSCFALTPIRCLWASYPAELPNDAIAVMATVLRPRRTDNWRSRPVLISQAPFDTDPIAVVDPRFASAVRLPFLQPPLEHLSKADELADAYNRLLADPVGTIPDSPDFDFPHRMLSDEAVTQFSRLNTWGRSPEIDARKRSVPESYRQLFAGATTLWSVSRIAFDSSHSHAVLGVRYFSAGCRGELWQALARNGAGVWEILPWSAGKGICA